jgi:hypothetical protein
MKNKNSALIGAKILIDWPVRWKNARPEIRESLKTEASQKEAHFGHVATVAAYNPGQERGNEYVVVLDDGTVTEIYQGAFTVTEMPASEINALREQVDLLKEILTVLKTNS